MKLNLAQLEAFVAGAPHDVRMFFIGLGKAAPLLGSAASVAETLAGAGAAAPLTQAAVAGAVALGNEAQAQETATATPSPIQVTTPQ